MALAWKVPVFSSMVAEVGYDADTKDMIIVWAKGGKTSAYANVPEELALDLSRAASVGQMLTMEVKPYYAHRYI